MVDDVSIAIQVVLTGVLAVATVALAWYTKTMAFAVWNQVDWTVRPVVVPTLEFVGPAYATFRFENVGNGVANDVRVKITSDPVGLEGEWAYPSLLPRQSASILLPETYRNLDTLLKLAKVHFETSCQDVLGYPRPQQHTLQIGPFRESMARTPTRYEETGKELEEAQTEALKKIAAQLEKLVRAKGHE